MPATTLNLASLLSQQARLTPDRTALVCGDRRLTFREVDAAANQLASGLRTLGLGPGDRISLACPNVPQFPIAYYAILKLGAIVVPQNVLLKPPEIAYHLADSDAKAMLVFEGTPELPMAAMARTARDAVPSCRHVIVMPLDSSRPPAIDGTLALVDVVAAQSPTFDTEPTAPGDTAVILYTSGTTGQAKGAELTHLNMTLNAIASRDVLAPLLNHGAGAINTTLVTLPLFHSTGQTAQMNAGMAGGWTMVLLPRFDAAAMLAAVERERVNIWVGVPTMYWTLLQHVREHDLDPLVVAASLRVCASGGAPMPVAMLSDFERVFGVRVLEGYGLTETSPVACFNQVQRPSKPGTVGLPIAGCEVRVVDAQDLPLPVGERGEIVIRGSNVMKGYYQRPVETAEALRGGWFHTGDVGVIDADGYVSIVDRLKDVILRGGMNVYPSEVEAVLMTHPAVSLAGVVGVPDERLGEEVKAFVVVRPGAALLADDLIAWARAEMAAYKYPRVIEFVASLPIGPTGKVVRRRLGR